MLRIEFHQQPSGFIGRGRGLAVEEIGGDRGEAFAGETVNDLFDVRHQSPPLLNDHDAGPFAGEISLTGVAVRRKFDALAHADVSSKSARILMHEELMVRLVRIHVTITRPGERWGFDDID